MACRPVSIRRARPTLNGTKTCATVCRISIISCPRSTKCSGLFPGESAPDALAARLLDGGVRVVALKMGERGSLVTDGDQTHRVAPFAVEALDATGAGDAFAAGFLAGVLHDFSLLEAARLGNAAGALVVTRTGTIAGYRSLQATRAWMERQGQSDKEPEA